MPPPTTASVPIRRVRAASGGATIAAEVREPPGAGATVVMLPSLARGAADFTPAFGSDLAARVAAAGHRVVLPWPRGFDEALSTHDGTPPTMELLARDVAAVIDAHVPDAPVTVLGHAFGQRVARVLAAVRPDLVSRLVLLAAGGIAPIPPEALRALATLALTPTASLAERRAALELAFFAPGNDPTVWLEGWSPAAGRIQQQANVATGVDVWWTGGDRAPIYVLQADHDAIAPAADSSARLQAALPGRVEIATITNAGHAMLPEQPRQVAEAVLGFLAR